MPGIAAGGFPHAEEWRYPQAIASRSNRLENEADQVSQQAIATLLTREKDPINLIKIKELLECLERAATDKAEDVANVWKPSS